jgi:CheY-like chemotaxis protein
VRETLPRRVLILEDEPIIGLALEDMLLELGVAQVDHADTLAEAEAILSGSAVEFAVLDVNIHGQQSYGFAERLRLRAIPFIFATGYGDIGHPEQLRSVPTLAKPYSPRDLEAAMASAWRQTTED